MQFRSIIRIVGMLVALFSVTMLAPSMVALIYQDGAGRAFWYAFLICLALGGALWYPNRYCKAEMKVKEGFLIVVLFWTVLGSVGALPFLLSSEPSLSVSEAFFESFSGLTTTGATVITGIEYLPKAVLFYRQLLQWLGGMGIIVLAVAILPILGIGGMQLYRAEIPGPVKDAKMKPRIAETAKSLWYIYLSLTVACAMAYWGAGMNLFDAISHSFSTIAIGGFSTYDASLGYFESPMINFICAAFLLLAGFNFTLHFTVLNGRSLRGYWQDPELRFFLLIQLALTVLCFIVLVNEQIYDTPEMALDQAFFQAVSISTTAGFTTDSFSEWPLFLPVMLIFASTIGGCAGSTGGGMKVIRILLLVLQGARELRRLVHPKAIYAIKLGNKPIPDRVIDAVWGFFAAYALVYVLVMLSLMALGMDDLSAFSATLACLNNLGPGLGVVAANFADIPDGSMWVLIVAMLFGRLEIFTLLVLFTPAFWRS